MKEMKQYTIAEVCSRLSSGKGIPASKVTPTGQYPVIGGNGIRGYTDSFNFDGECAVIGRQGANCGNVRYFQGKAYMTEHAIVAIGNEKANTKYLACLFSLMHLGNLSAQSAQPGLSVQTLSKQIVNLPHISTQNQIADIIRSLDTKIELNKYINDNLEQQAKALYKSWFVDFEPFKDGDFIESEIGEIPAGWSIVKFSDISETPKKTINPQKFPDTTFYHYSLPACDNGLIPEIQIGKDIMSNKIIMQNNTTLFSKLNPRIKRIWFTGEVLPNSICSTEFIPFRAKYDTESSYIFSIVNSDAFYATVMGCVNGATGSHQRFHAEDTEDFLCPYNKDVVNEFSKLVEPILSQMHDLRHENVMLASTRDALLPKLMSGELKINETDC